MKTAVEVDSLIQTMKEQGKNKQDIAWQVALNCVGWAYVFGARGQYCDPVNRRNYYNSHKDHPTIKSACKNFNGSDKVVGACSSCKWYPGGRTRFYDCRGFTYWILKRVYDGWELMGAGATSQWDNASNWKAKGEIATMPKNVLCCLFVRKNNKMEHTGFGLNNETIECSSGVQHFTSRNKKWTHWAVPVVIDGEYTPDKDADEQGIGEAVKDGFPMLKKGSKGEYVTLLQTKLVNKGYSVGSYGIDGDFGSGTEKAVKQFQKDHGLNDDGIVGKNTWDALNAQESNLYTVTIPSLPKFKAEALVKDYPGSSMKAEGA